jgi:hypothetical protein
MTERCDASARRPRDYSSTEAACEPTREEAATSQVEGQQAAEREAEARRNAYFASGTDEGGRSKRASSDLGAMQSSTPDDKNARLIAYYKAHDPHIESDPLGNALVGIAAGGIIGGVEAGVGKVGLAGARGMFLQPASQALVKGVVVGEETGAAAFAKGAAEGAAVTAAKAVRNAALLDGVPALAKNLVEASAAEKPKAQSSSTVAGQSSKSGASVPVAEPTRSEGPRIPEMLPPAMLPIKG